MTQVENELLLLRSRMQCMEDFTDGMLGILLPDLTPWGQEQLVDMYSTYRFKLEEATHAYNVHKSI